MPAVKIELQTGKDKQTLIKLKNSVMDSVIEGLQLPDNDRNIRLMEYQPELFQMKPPYEMLIEITLFSGRTKDTKRKLYKSIVDRLEAIGLVEKEKVFIILNEQIAENWAIRGGIPADEVELGFKVNV